MPEVDGNDPEIRSGTYINLIPCATSDVADPLIAHAYEARQVVGGEITGALGWLTLEAAREKYVEVPYAVRRASHAICPSCVELWFGDES